MMTKCPFCRTPLAPAMATTAEGRLEELADACRVAHLSQQGAQQWPAWNVLQDSEQRRWLDFAREVKAGLV